MLIWVCLFETQCRHAGCVCTPRMHMTTCANYGANCWKTAGPRPFFTPEPTLLWLRRALSLSLCVGADGSGVAVWRAGAGVMVLMWDDSIGAGLMGLICSNWKWSRSWSWGQGSPGAYCHHTSARWRRWICVCWSPGGGRGLRECILRGLSAYVRA